MKFLLFSFYSPLDLAPEHTPTWPVAHQLFGATQVNFDPQLLISNDLFLTIYLLSSIKIQHATSDGERITFLQELQTKLADRKTTEATEAAAILVWGHLIMCGGHIMTRSEVAKNQLSVIARYFQFHLTQPEGWGDGLLGAIGLKKENQTNKKKILLRCFSCAIFALFRPSVTSEYENAILELKGALSNKKFADVRMPGMQATALIESKSDAMLDGFTGTITSLIRLFYQDSFLNTIEYFYNW